MKKCKCSNLGVDLEKTVKCRCLRQTAVTQLSNKLTKTASSGRKRKAVLASLTKEQLVKRFLELESRVAVLEMQMEAVKRAEEEIAEVGEEDYDFFKGEFPMSRSFFLLYVISVLFFLLRDTAERIRWYQERIFETKEENEYLMAIAKF